MSRVPENAREPLRRMSELLHRIPPGRRPAVMRSVTLFRPVGTLDQEFAIGELRAAFAEAWEVATCGPIPIEPVRRVVGSSRATDSLVDFSQFMMLGDRDAVESELASLIGTLSRLTNGDGAGRKCDPERPLDDAQLQAEYERRFREQISRRSCPGCGETWPAPQILIHVL